MYTEYTNSKMSMQLANQVTKVTVKLQSLLILQLMSKQPNDLTAPIRVSVIHRYWYRGRMLSIA